MPDRRHRDQTFHPSRDRRSLRRGSSQGGAISLGSFLPDPHDLYPAHLAKDSHTFGTQWFEARTLNGTFAIAGDTAYWYSKIEQMWPPGYHQGNPFNQLFTYDRIRRTLGKELERLIPGHDPQVWHRHKTWTVGPNEVAEITLAKGQRSKKR